MEYYGIITVAIILFGVTFFFNDRYQKESGSGIGATFIFSLINSAVGLLCDQKPSWQELVSVGLSFVGVLILVFLA